MASDSAEPSDSAELVCHICQLPLHDGTSVEALPCAHTMHEYCLSEYALAKCVEKAAVPCPVCKMPACLAETNVAIPEPPASWVAEPAVLPSEPPEVDFEPVVAQGKGGGKRQRGCPKAKTKAKAKTNAKSGKDKGKGKGKGTNQDAEATDAEATVPEAQGATVPAADAMVEDTLQDQYVVAEFAQCHYCGKECERK